MSRWIIDFSFSIFLLSGGFVVFTIRTEAFDNESYGYSIKCDELEKAKKWELVSREKRVLYAQLDDDKYNLCYLITYKVLNNWSVLHAQNLYLNYDRAKRWQISLIRK